MKKCNLDCRQKHMVCDGSCENDKTKEIDVSLEEAFALLKEKRPGKVYAKPSGRFSFVPDGKK